jgi:predicted ATPase
MRGSESIRLHFFGYPHAESKGEGIELRSRRAWGLLAFLLLTAMEHSRESISTLFWPDLAANRASANLRNLLWVINQTKLAACVGASRSTLRADREADVWVDVHAFRDAVADVTTGNDVTPAALGDAVALYRGHLLAGLNLDVSHEFDDWRQMESSALLSDLATLYAELAAQSRGDSETARVLRSAERWLGTSGTAAAVGVGSKAGHGAPIGTGRVRGAPRFRSPLVGRSGELALIEKTLFDSDPGLVSLVGPGGSGKTHLASVVASRCARRFAEGAYFVSLAHVETARDFILTLGDAIGVPLSRAIPSAGPRDQLPLDALGALKARDALLILDNVEQLPATYPWMAALTEDDSKLHVVVTSRHELELSHERVVRITGLPWPDATDDEEAALQTESVQLFVALSQQHNPEFSPTSDDVQAIARICRALEGMPLAIELASSWVRSGSCEEIAAQVEREAESLTTSERDTPRRHRSLRAVFLQSWARLSRPERAALRRLSAFHGPFSAEASSSVIGLAPAALATLVRRSFVKRLPDGRYQLLRIVRGLLAERLRALPEEKARLHRRHALYYLNELAGRRGELRSTVQKRAARALVSSFENIEAAWRAAIALGMHEELVAASRPLFTLLQLQNYFVDGVALFGELGSSDCTGRSGSAKVTRYLGEFFEGWFLVHDDERTGLEKVHQARSRLERVEAPADVRAMATVLTTHIDVGTRSRPTVAREELEGCLEHFTSLSDEDGIALSLEALGLLVAVHSAEEALPIVARSLAIREGMGDQWGVASVLVVLGGVLVGLRDFAEAERALTRALAIHRRLQMDPFNEMGAWAELAWVSHLTGRMEESRDRFRSAYDLARTIGAKVALGSTAESLARISHAMGEQDVAERYADEAVALYTENGDAKRLARCLEFVHSELAS